MWLQDATEKKHVTASMGLAIELAQHDDSALRNDMAELTSKLDSLRHRENKPEPVAIEFFSSPPLVDHEQNI